MRANRNAIADRPRSSRVVVTVPANLDLAKLNTAAALPSPPASPVTSPPLPPRSPLRPKANTTPTDNRSSIYATHIADALDMTLAHSHSLGSIPGLMESHNGTRPKTPDKPLPMPPRSSAPPMPNNDVENTSRMSVPRSTPRPPSLTKREHALLELLSTERAYASDLALMREVHIPLALGQPSTFDAAPSTPPSSSPSSRATSTASASSSGSSHPAPMSQEDVRIIFNNIAEIAEFADQFTEVLEDALGSVVEGGTGVDHVGALFLETIPMLESLYSTYITRHPTALEHLNKLEKTPLLKEYLERTQTLSQALSHAWDMSSLLIKPVQRLMKYSLLLTAIIDETPATHPDKDNLKLARDRIEAVTHGVNEGRRRREVVKEVLCRKGAEAKPRKKGLNLGIAAAINLGRVKSIRASTFKIKEGKEGNLEAEQVARMGEELKACEVFARHFAKEAISWIDATTALTLSLRGWAIKFGDVTGTNGDNHSAAYDAFLMLIDHGLLQICTQFKQVIQTKLLPEMARLADATNDPEQLLEAMRTLEPLHYGLLNMNIAKSRPPPELQQASQSYVALRSQLHGELPLFLNCFKKGVAAIFRQLITWQTEFWRAYRLKWEELWEALRVEGEMEGSADETLKVWWARFYDIVEAVEGLDIVHPLQEPVRPPTRQEPARPPMRQRGYSLNDAIETGSTVSTVLISTMTAPGPVRTVPSMSSSQTLVPSSPPSPRSQQLEKKMSSESVHSRKSGRSGRSHKHSNSSVSQMPLPTKRNDLFSTDDPTTAYTHVIHSIVNNPLPQKPSYQRTASMPISLPMPLRKASSQGRLLEGAGSRISLPSTARNTPQGTPPQQQQYDPYSGFDDDTRGRSSRKPSTKRKGKDSSASASRPRTHRSPSLPDSKSFTFTASSSQQSFPGTPSSALGQARATWAGRQGLYQCHAIHPCAPPPGVSYNNIPFLTVKVGDIFDVLEEKGHPAKHRNLPLSIDDGEDCLLLVRDMHDDIGWALASFLFPVG